MSLIQDIRYASRSLARSPGLTGIAILSFGLGAGAATAIYSVLHAVVLDPFAYKDVDSLTSVKVWDPAQRGYRTGYSVDQFVELRDRNGIFEGTIASTISDIVWTGAGDPQRLRGNHVSFDTFEVMGVPALIGRYATSADAEAGAPPVCVLGFKFWQRQFGGDPGVVGRTLTLNGIARTVVGVMPRRFMWRGADVYAPVAYRRGESPEGVRFVHVLGRLKPGVSEALAERDLRPIVEELRQRDPGAFPEKFRVGLLSFKETFPSGIREVLWLMFGAVGLLLLIACANVSNLLLSRAAGRRREMAVRASLGAGRGRLVRQLLTESLLLSLAGAAVGVALALASLRGILALAPPATIPDEAEIALNLPVLLFALAVAALCSILFGLAPALHAATPDLTEPLKESARSAGGGRRAGLFRSGLVVAELSLSVVLLAGAALMIRTVLAVQSIDTGLPIGSVLTMRVPLSERQYTSPARRAAFFRDLLQRVETLPGVTAAAVNTWVHPIGNMSVPVVVDGVEPSERRVVVHQVSEAYPRVMGIPSVAGRSFEEADVAVVRRLALVNQAFVRLYFAERPALGARVRIPRLRSAPYNMSDDAFEIVGVVRDTVNAIPATEISPELYIPFTVTGMANHLLVRTPGSPQPLAASIRAQVHALDRDQPVTDVKTLETWIAELVYARPRFNLTLFSMFAFLGLALAVIGVYGVISHAVARQTQEIGIRMALGARTLDVARMVLLRGSKLLLLGLAFGIAAAWAVTRLLKQQIWQVAPFDPLSLGAVSLLLLATGLLACLLPALRAAAVQPVRALRDE
jgi:predicted permease